MAQLAPLLVWMMSCSICGSTLALVPSSIPSYTNKAKLHSLPLWHAECSMRNAA